jgi:hypothetical protein
VLVHFNRAASIIVNANYSIMRSAVMRRLSDGIAGSVRFAVREPTEWQRIGNQIDSPFVFARADFVNAVRAGQHARPAVRCIVWLDDISDEDESNERRSTPDTKCNA